MKVNKRKFVIFLQFCLDKGEKTNQADELVNAVYGLDIVTPNLVFVYSVPVFLMFNIHPAHACQKLYYVTIYAANM